MNNVPASLQQHRVSTASAADVVEGEVRYAPVKSLWFLGMAAGAVVGGLATFTWAAFALFVVTTGIVLLFGHSLGSHRKLIHDSYQCPKWLEYTLVYCGVQVGLAGPLGLMRQHELRDYAQRLPDCHDYLRHGQPWWVDAWWQLNCELRLAREPDIRIESRVADDRFYRFLEATWMWQQLPFALVFYAWGGWAFVFWGVCARVTAGVFGHWLIGYFAHNQGGMHYEVVGAAVQGRNVAFTSLITMGESWHNNHHAFPGSARLGLYAGEWDPGWWVLMALRRAGLVWGVRVPRDLPARPELRAIPEAAAGTLRGTFLAAPQGPLSVRQLRWLVGPQVPVLARPLERRLVLFSNGRRLQGLPALVEAVRARGGLARWLAAPLAAPAAAFESFRTAFDMS